MSEFQRKCINGECGRDISDDVVDACRRSVIVYRGDNEDEEQSAAGPRKVFVECPFCGTEAEYRCSPAPPEARHGLR